MPVFYPLQVDTKISPVGEDIIGFSKAYNIGGVSVDNPTTSWLSVDTIPGGVFVPPLTLGWATPLAIPKRSIDVRFVDAPFGAASILSGTPISVTIYEARPDGGASVEISQGVSISLQTSQLTKATLDFLIQESLNNDLVVSGTAGQRIIPVRIHVTPYDPANNIFKSITSDVWLLFQGVTSLGSIAMTVLTPENPTQEFTNLDLIAPNLDAGEGVRVVHNGKYGGGRKRLFADFIYYTESA